MDFICTFIDFIDSVHSAEPNDKKNDESNNHQSNEMKNQDVYYPASVDEYSVLEFCNTMPKNEYTRSQLIDLESNACGFSGDNDNVVTKLSERDLVRNKAVKFIDKLRSKEAATDAAIKQVTQQLLNDDFWSKATTNNQNESHDSESLESDYQAVLTKASIDNRFVLPFSNDSKVGRWLNSGQNPSEYADATVNEPVLASAKLSDANQPDESASALSAKSALRAKLLDRTAKVKQTLRNLTNNN